jgi:hypothetical protein
MKRITLLLLLSTLFIFSKSYSQTIYSDANFLKANLCLYGVCSNFDAVYKAENQQAEGENKLPQIKATLDIANKYYLLVKAKYATDKEFKTFEQNIQVIQKCYNYLKENDNTWALAYTLVKMNLEEMANKKIK